MATCRRIDIWTSSCALAIIKNTTLLLRRYYRVPSAHRAHLSHAFKPRTRNRLIRLIHNPSSPLYVGPCFLCGLGSRSIRMAIIEQNESQVAGTSSQN